MTLLAQCQVEGGKLQPQPKEGQTLPHPQENGLNSVRNLPSAQPKDPPLHDLHRLNEGALNNDFDRQYLKKREDLRKSLVDEEFSKKKAAVESQKALLSKNVRNRISLDSHDPLMQLNLRDKKKLANLENRAGLAGSLSKDRGRQRKLLVDKLPNQSVKHDPPSLFNGNVGQESNKVSGRSRIQALGDFDMEGYLNAQRITKGEAMKRFQFNQIASDATPPDRYLKDYRNTQ